MGTVLFDAEDYLKSVKSKFTPAEEDVLQSCKGRALKDFSLAAVIASAAVWRVTRRIGYVHRINLAGGAGICAGFYVFGKSLNSTTEKILSLEGSRLQSEFAKKLVIMYGDNPRTVQMLEKYFYKENVYDDSNVDRTIARWRHRSSFGENAALGQIKHDDTYGADTDSEQKQVIKPTHSPAVPAAPLKSSIEVSTDPFDCLFGHSDTLEEKNQPRITPLKFHLKDVHVATEKQLVNIGSATPSIRKPIQNDVESLSGTSSGDLSKYEGIHQMYPQL